MHAPYSLTSQLWHIYAYLCFELTPNEIVYKLTLGFEMDIEVSSLEYVCHLRSIV